MFFPGAPAHTAQINGDSWYSLARLPPHPAPPSPPPPPPPGPPPPTPITTPHPPLSPSPSPPDHQEAKDNEIHALNADIALLRGQQASGDDSVSVSAGVEAAIQQRLNRIADLNNTALPRVMQVSVWMGVLQPWWCIQIPCFFNVLPPE